MIGLLLIAAAAIGTWAWRTREARAMRFADVAAVVALLVALRLLSRHEIIPGLVALAGAGWWYRLRSSGRRPESSAMSREAARRLLDLPPGAGQEDIKAAHRRLIARIHPDAGGSADLTSQVNAARDILLDRRRPL